MRGGDHGSPGPDHSLRKSSSLAVKVDAISPKQGIEEPQGRCATLGPPARTRKVSRRQAQNASEDGRMQRPHNIAAPRSSETIVLEREMHGTAIHGAILQVRDPLASAGAVPQQGLAMTDTQRNLHPPIVGARLAIRRQIVPVHRAVQVRALPVLQLKASEQ